eukprot:CAMPEP_0196585230 /NCGR_PEP_ID=MMETSP1081-20130531/49957_1 /TAXON_ID=36882 /ORGANISM="Pyramimonas amylifera, Strain CCMP720" /LENGTH=86 /DNA_ID=CAMNT_0041906707 /DNA_START=237 /DNA_END=497 /DNA_ORIENTATION=-
MSSQFKSLPRRIRESPLKSFFRRESTQSNKPSSYYTDEKNVKAYHSLTTWSGAVAVILAVGSIYELYSARTETTEQSKSSIKNDVE